MHTDSRLIDSAGLFDGLSPFHRIINIFNELFYIEINIIMRN